MEFIAILLLAPLIWNSPPVEVVPMSMPKPKPNNTTAAPTAARLDWVGGRMVILPPKEASLTMTVLDSRSPASSSPDRYVDVIVSAP